MEGLSTQARTLRWASRGRWELLRLSRALQRRLGWMLPVFVACGVVAVGASAWRVHTVGKLHVAQERFARSLEAAPLPTGDDRGDLARRRLLAFEAGLVAYEEMPVVLQDLIDRAKASSLILPKGEYAPSFEQAGGFARYQMSFPVKGPADAVTRFIVAALSAHKSLVLEAAQFKRDRGSSPDVEVRLKLVLLTRLPERYSATGRAEVRP